jgi:hypothetical protein
MGLGCADRLYRALRYPLGRKKQFKWQMAKVKWQMVCDFRNGKS